MACLDFIVYPALMRIKALGSASKSVFKENKVPALPGIRTLLYPVKTAPDSRSIFAWAFTNDGLLKKEIKNNVAGKRNFFFKIIDLKYNISILYSFTNYTFI